LELEKYKKEKGEEVSECGILPLRPGEKMIYENKSKLIICKY